MAAAAVLNGMVAVCVWGVGQLGMAHRSDGPASSLRMFGHVCVCGGGLASSPPTTKKAAVGPGIRATHAGSYISPFRILCL